MRRFWWITKKKRLQTLKNTSGDETMEHDKTRKMTIKKKKKTRVCIKLQIVDFPL